VVDLRQKAGELLSRNFYCSGSISITETGLVSVDGNVKSIYPYMQTLDREVVSEIPVKFQHVSGDFVVPTCRLTSLKGSPESVGGVFNCKSNKITSLAPGPKTVGLSYICGYNPLVSLEGCPEVVPGDFYCESTQIQSFQGAPKVVGDDLFAIINPLKSLDGFPDAVGALYLSYTSDLPLLKALVAPQLILAGAPEKITQIMKTFEGQGRRAAFACKKQLIEAGFIKNARW
jgi:hypothetical protein